MSTSTTPRASRLSAVSAPGLGLLLAIGALLIAGCDSNSESGDVTEPGEGITRQISGRWKGKLQQNGLGAFKIAVDLGADGLAQVAYSGINCAGDWSFEGVVDSLPPGYVFAEVINQGAGGACKGAGTVSLLPIQDQLPNAPAYNRLKYQFTGGGVTSRGLIRRTDVEHLAPIFKQAGIEPPPVEP
jgi:hypothetical protein